MKPKFITCRPEIPVILNRNGELSALSTWFTINVFMVYKSPTREECGSKWPVSLGHSPAGIDSSTWSQFIVSILSGAVTSVFLPPDSLHACSSFQANLHHLPSVLTDRFIHPLIENSLGSLNCQHSGSHSVLRVLILVLTAQPCCLFAYSLTTGPGVVDGAFKQ